MIALGTLGMTITDFYRHTFNEVMYKFVAHRVEHLRQENNLRRSAFYTLAGQGVKIGNKPLEHLHQLWHIEEIDGPVDQLIKVGTARKATDEEMRLLRERPKGWMQKLKEMES